MNWNNKEIRNIHYLVTGEESITHKADNGFYNFEDSLWRNDIEMQLFKIDKNLSYLKKLTTNIKKGLMVYKEAVLGNKNNIDIKTVKGLENLSHDINQFNSFKKKISYHAVSGANHTLVSDYIEDGFHSNTANKLASGLESKLRTFKDLERLDNPLGVFTRISYNIDQIVKNSHLYTGNALSIAVADVKHTLLESEKIINNFIETYDITKNIDYFKKYKEDIDNTYKKFLKEVEVEPTLADLYYSIVTKEKGQNLEYQLKKLQIQSDIIDIEIQHSCYKALKIFKDNTIALIDVEGNISIFTQKKDILNVMMGIIKDYTREEFKSTPKIASILNQLFEQQPTELGHFISLKTNLIENKQILKNIGFNIIDYIKELHDKNTYKCYNESLFEDIEDHMNAQQDIYHKRQYAHSISSNKYQHLYNEESYRLLAMLYEEKISRELLQNAIGKKMALFKDSNEFNAHILNFYNKINAFELDVIKDRAIQADVKVISDENNTLMLKIDNFEQSKLLGSNSWCISTRETYFDSYTDNREQYFFFDFNKETSDKNSMIGFTLSKDKSVHAAHSRFDESISNNDPYLKKICQIVLQEESKNEKKLKFKNN